MKARLDLIGMTVRDMPASLAFYRALGLDIPAGMDQEGHVEAALPGGLRLAWDTYETMRSFQPDWQPPSGSQGISLAFLCEGPAEVDALFEQLTGMGHPPHLAPFDAFWGQRYASVLDPDGNVVDLFAPLP